MHIDIQNLVEGANRFRIDDPPDGLTLPMDEAIFPSLISVVGTLTKTGNNVLLHADLSTTVTMECSRCLMGYPEQITGELVVLYQRAERGIPVRFVREQADEMEMLDYEAKQIDIGWRIEEAIRLGLPLKPLCREDCRGLCPMCGTDLNDATCDCRSDHEDPRWQALKMLFKDH